MGLLLPLVLCALALCCGARSPPAQPFQFPRSCNDSDVLAVAGFALQDINRDRKDGYVLSLNRVSNAWEQREGGPGSLFYLTLDVLETGCHVLSKKAWKDCAVRNFYESVYGQCKVMFYHDRPRRVLYLLAYNCTLRPVSREKIMCPDCPFPISTESSNPDVMEAVTESLAKYNNENTSKQYSLVKVTRATAQWVVGPAYFVEYLIKESPCIKTQDGSCSFPSSDSEPVGLCTGYLVQRNRMLPPGVTGPRREKSVTVTCDLFETQGPTPGGENSAVNQEPANLHKVQGHQQENTSLTDSPSEAGTKGSVQYLPSLDDEKSDNSQEKAPQDAFPVQLDLTTKPQGETLDVSFLFLGPMRESLVVLPFPKGKHHSAQCPGPAQVDRPFLLPP